MSPLGGTSSRETLPLVRRQGTTVPVLNPSVSGLLVEAVGPRGEAVPVIRVYPTVLCLLVPVRPEVRRQGQPGTPAPGPGVVARVPGALPVVQPRRVPGTSRAEGVPP